MSVELATAYISLVPSTRGFAAETNKQIAPAMAKQGGQIGDGMLAGIGKSLKIGAVAVGAVAVGGIGTALVKGSLASMGSIRRTRNCRAWGTLPKRSRAS